MHQDQARLLVGEGVDGLPAREADRLAGVAGRWPVLLNVVNGVLRRRIAHGQPPDQAAAEVLDRLVAEGPAAFDPARAADRSRAVGATVEASLTLLDAADQQRYLDLAIFPADVDIPLNVLVLMWPERRVDALCEELVGLGLAADYRLDRPANGTGGDACKPAARGAWPRCCPRQVSRHAAPARAGAGLAAAGADRRWRSRRLGDELRLLAGRDAARHRQRRRDGAAVANARRRPGDGAGRPHRRRLGLHVLARRRAPRHCQLRPDGEDVERGGRDCAGGTDRSHRLGAAVRVLAGRRGACQRRQRRDRPTVARGRRRCDPYAGRADGPPDRLYILAGWNPDGNGGR